MRDMYEVLDRWGAWAAADSSGVDWQSIAAGFKGLLPHGKKSRFQCDDEEGIADCDGVCRWLHFDVRFLNTKLHESQLKDWLSNEKCFFLGRLILTPAH